MKGRIIRYSDAELLWIFERRTQPRRQLHAEFCQQFQRTDIAFDNFKALCTRKGWRTGRTGRFPKGQTPANKGKKMPFNAKRAATQFKRGHLPHNTRGAGHERIDNKDGYVVMIIDEVNPWTGAATRPVHKHRWLWEQQHGPLPDGMVLKCLDGDKTNTDPSNWEAIPRAMLPRLNGRFGRDYDAAPAELKPTILATAKLQHRAYEIRKEKKA